MKPGNVLISSTGQVKVTVLRETRCVEYAK